MFPCSFGSVESLFEFQLEFLVHGDCSIISNDAVVQCVCCFDDSGFLLRVSVGMVGISIESMGK